MKKRLFIFVVFAVLTLNSFAQDAYIGEIRMFAGNFAPKNWAFCDGSLLQFLKIRRYTQFWVLRMVVMVQLILDCPILGVELL